MNFSTLLFLTLLANSCSKPEIKAPSKIPANCLCVKIWLPVCGENQVTYGNSCEAKCAGVNFVMGSCGDKETRSY